MLKIGTSHFLSFAAAVRYYRDYYGNKACVEVSRMLREGEIHLGRPACKSGQTAGVILGEGRWCLIEEDSTISPMRGE